MTNQYDIIEFIKLKKEVSMKDILEHFECEKSNIYRQMKKLRKYHLVEYKLDGLEKVIMVSGECD